MYRGRGISFPLPPELHGVQYSTLHNGEILFVSAQGGSTAETRDDFSASSEECGHVGLLQNYHGGQAGTCSCDGDSHGFR